MSNSTGLQLIIAGDIHDNKANLRGECVKAMLDILETAVIMPYIIVSNHDRLNEKSEEHSLEFLRNTVNLVTSPTKWRGLTLIPYHHDPDELRAYLKTLPDGATLIMHQGIEGSHSGDYIQDRSALNKYDVERFRVISGHYHRRQDIKIGRPRKGAVGLWSYIGNPYTLNYGEASDPEKGFQILRDDGLLEFVPTNLRKHIIIDHNLTTGEYVWSSGPAYDLPDRKDIVWARVRGPKEKLSKLTKDAWTKEYGLPRDIRLDLIPDETEVTAPTAPVMNQHELYDDFIDSLTNTSDERKNRLKGLWKQFI